MGDNKISDTTSFDAFKGKLSEEFEKMTLTLKEEKKVFANEMDRRKKEIYSEVKIKLDDLATEKSELNKAKSQLDEETSTLKQLREEFEQEKKSYLKKIEEEQSTAKTKEAMRLKKIETRTQALEIGNQGLVQQKLTIERELKDLSQTYKEQKESHLGKIVALKNQLDELEDQIEQKLYFIGDQEPPDYDKNNRELIVSTVTGDTYRGTINISSKERLSDMFTKVKIPFIVMYDVTFKGEEKATIIINKQNIVSVKPLEEQPEQS
jgi:hypothetical protein